MSGDTGPLGLAQVHINAQQQAEIEQLRERLHEVSDLAQASRLLLELVYYGAIPSRDPRIARVIGIGIGNDAPIISGAEARKERG